MRRHASAIGCAARARGSQPRTREAPGPDRGHYDPSAGSLLDWDWPNRLVPGNADPGNRNRRHFDELARAEWARFQRYGRPLSLLLLDIDKFKSINDRFGHDAGDLVLKAVAHICQTTKRQSDVAARTGGEEFALLLPETDEATAVVAAERLRKAIQIHTRALPGENLKVTVSIGVAGAALGMPVFEAMLKRADEALYEAKRSGRNRVVRAPRTMTDKYPVAA
jgi:diguanylate cyclase (GGDEF)-like protein